MNVKINLLFDIICLLKQLNSLKITLVKSMLNVETKLLDYLEL